MRSLLMLIAFVAASPAVASPDAERLVAGARVAVEEMERLARTPEERELARRDRMIVEKAATLVSRRAAAVRSGVKVQEAEMAFNQQYLQLQSQMQHENRSYTAISNIMKTKHQTVKSSILNIR